MDRTRPKSSSVGRRVAGALIVAAVVLGSLGLTVALATSSRGDFTFAQAHAGDRWSYSMELGDGWTFGPNDTVQPGTAQPAFDFAWTAPVPVRLADGEQHASARVDVDGVVYDGEPAFPGSITDDGRHWSEYQRSAWIGPDGDLMAIVVGGGRGVAGGSGSWGLPGTPVVENSQSVTMRVLVTDYEPTSGLCLADLLVAGRTVDLDQDVVLSRACHLGGVLDLPDDLWFEAGEVETVSGIEALRFDARGADIHLWYHPTIPYPVQVQASGQGGPFEGDDGAVLLRMTGFAPGTAPVPVRDDLPDRDASPALQETAPRLWGPDDAEAPVEFPLSEAFARARDDPDFPDLRDYLATHDGVFATSGHLMVEDQQTAEGPFNRSTGRALTWSLDLDSPTGCFWFSATKQTAEAETAPGVGPFAVPVPMMEPRYETTYSYNTHEFGCVEDDYEAPKPSAPRSWPSVASALAQWESYATAEELEQGPTGWAFRLRYRDDGWHQEFSVGQSAGRSLRTTTSNSMSYTGTGGAGGSLDYEDGRIVSYSRVTTVFSREGQVAGLPLDQATTREGAEGGDIVHGQSGFGDLSPVEVTGVAVFAALAALAYFLWPWLKAGAFAGLFSRLQAPALLDHPVRKELLHRIEAQPGIHYQDLVRAMGKGKGAVEHHLRKLQEAGLAKALAAGGYTCWFPTTYDRRLVGAAPALKSEGARAVLAAVRSRPGASAREVGLATGLSAAAVNHHLQRLGAAGLVSITRIGRSLSIMPTDLASQVGNGTAAGAA